MKKLLLFLLIFNFQFSIFNSFAQTNVSGGIYANTTWTLANSPYIVVDTVVVFPGVTLTIQPGVVVKFADNKRLEIRNAVLIAEGTVTDSITFTSNNPSPTPGIHGGVYLNNSSTTGISYCNFMFGRYGFKAGSSDSILIIKNSKFISNDTGLTAISSSFNLIIDSCDFNNNVNQAWIGGVYSYPTIVDHCHFFNNNSCIYLYYGVFSQQTVIKNSTFELNQYGIYATEYAIFDNCVINNNQYGIYNSYGGNTFKNCSIDSNSVYGVRISGDTLINCEISNNAIGIWRMGGYLVTMNIIENNTIGLKSYSSFNNDVYCNKFCNNTSYDLYYYATNNSSLSNNYWCTLDSDSITAKIYDGYDNVSYGLVTFEPVDSNQCYLNGCNVHITANVINATCDTCHNGSATAYISNGFPPYSYSWFTSPIQTTQTATGLSSGTYTVCITDGHGCTACNYNVFVDSTNCTGFAMNAVASNASCSLCSDGMAIANVNGGSPPYVYTWYTSPVQSNDTATGLSPGSYAVCVTDLYGCAVCDTVTVGVGSCSAYYNLYPDTAPHTYDIVNMASGTPPLTYDWNWGDGSPHDTAAYPSHTYSGAGTYTICLSITDSAGCTSSYCNGFYLLSMMSNVYVNVIPPTTTGIQTSTNEKTFSIFPNPTSGNLILHLSDNKAEVTIYNVLGEMKFHSAVSEKETILNVSSLSGGIYFIEVSAGNKVSRQRFVKQ